MFSSPTAEEHISMERVITAGIKTSQRQEYSQTSITWTPHKEGRTDASQTDAVDE
jgi:hypothetical protein